jgi:predicted O-linked N-acetylglucosamine transferase (SPINDLY family)
MTAAIPEWQQQAQKYFLQGNYSKAAALHEQAIAANPQVRNNYWYLGIALLLLEQEEKAQMIWLDAVAEGDSIQVEEWIKELIVALEEVAQIREIAEDYNGEWVLRQYIRENSSFSYDCLNNELHITFAALRANRLHESVISQDELEISFLPVVQLLCSEPPPSCDGNLLVTVCKQFKKCSLSLRQIFVNACIKYYQARVQQTPEDACLWCFLGNIYQEEVTLWQESQIAYETAISLHPTFAEAYYYYGNLLLMQVDIFNKKELLAKAFNYLQKAIDLSPNYTDALYRLGTLLEAQEKPYEAIICYEQVLSNNPKHLKAYRRYHLILPFLYNSFEDIQFWRSRFERGLKNYCETVLIDIASHKTEALESINCRTTFSLAYQGYNDLNLQCQYGKMVQRVMAANYPNWSQPLPMPKLSAKDKLRVGYLSSYIFNHSVGVMAIGYLQNCDRGRFEVYTYHIGTPIDRITQEFQNLSDSFYHIPNNLDALCHQIRADNLHVLFFLDIGMDIMTTQVAGLRLAPVQCVWAGHPETTGLPTIDYFLSSEAHEPDNAQEHYSEQLICLPKLSHVYHKPYIPDISKSRSEMELPEDATLYVSCQTPFKYLPQYDYLFVEIVKRVSSAKIVFCIGGNDDNIGQLLQRRIRAAFANSGLESEDFCIFRDRMGFNDYINLLSLCDASLDTIGFTGSNTTLQAVACGLPVVTLPTELMRGRQSYGILKVLGVMDTVAQSESEYIEIAVKLGCDREWRTSISAAMQAKHHLLYDDVDCVRGLERFFVEAVAKHGRRVLACQH